MNDKTPAASSQRSPLSPSLSPTSAALSDEEHSPPFFPRIAETDDEKSSFNSGRDAPGDALIVRESSNGKGVFAKRNFRKGETIIQFHGERLTREELLFAIDDGDSHYMQIGKGVYLGPSGSVDDFFNHSCDPNAGVIIEKENAFLVAIKTIPKNTEVTFDYSTTMDDDWEEMECNCNRSRCRKYVRDFKYLPGDVQKRYLRLKIVPEYISKHYQ